MVFNSVTGGHLRSPPRFNGEIRTVAISSDQSLWAIGLSSGQIQILRPSDFKTLATLEEHATEIVGLIFRADSHAHQLVSASEDGSIRLWTKSGETWRRERVLFESEIPIRSIDLSSDGSQLIAVRQGEFVVHHWDLWKLDDQLQSLQSQR